MKKKKHTSQMWLHGDGTYLYLPTATIFHLENYVGPFFHSLKNRTHGMVKKKRLHTKTERILGADP